MTREEARDKILELRLYGGLVGITCTDALEMALDSLEQEPCEDSISRQAVLDAISRIGLRKCSTNEVQAVAECLRAVEALPLVTPQPKTGYISIDDVMSVFDDFMRGEVDENDTETFLEMLKDRAEKEIK